MGEHTGKTDGKLKPAVRNLKDDQRIWREGRMDELRGRVVGSIEEANEKAKDVSKTLE